MKGRILDFKTELYHMEKTSNGLIGRASGALGRGCNIHCKT